MPHSLCVNNCPSSLAGDADDVGVEGDPRISAVPERVLIDVRACRIATVFSETNHDADASGEWTPAAAINS